MLNRINQIDFARGIAIIAVTLGHIMGSFGLRDSVLCSWMYSFELPVFFFVSGYLAQKRAGHPSAGVFVKRQLRSILYPYLMFSLVMMLLDILVCIRHGIFPALQQMIKDVLYICSGYGLGALWFMPTFFLATVIGFFLYVPKKCNNELLGLLAVTIGTAIVGGGLSYMVERTSGYRDSTCMKQILWHGLSQISRSIVGASLILTGRLSVLLGEKVSLGKSNKTCIGIASLLLLIGFFLGNMQCDFVDLHFSFIGNPLLFYGSALCTIAGLILVGSRIHAAGINWMGRNSLIFMFCQVIQKYWCLLLNRISEVKLCESAGKKYLAAIASLVVCLGLSAVVAWTIHHNRFFNLLIQPRTKGEGKG